MSLICSSSHSTLAPAGGLLDYEAVSTGLRTRKIGAVGLDVHWQEPFDPEDEIAKHPRCISDRDSHTAALCFPACVELGNEKLSILTTVVLHSQGAPDPTCSWCHRALVQVSTVFLELLLGPRSVLTKAICNFLGH